MHQFILIIVLIQIIKIKYKIQNPFIYIMSKEIQRERPVEQTENINENNFVLAQEKDKSNAVVLHGKSYASSLNSSQNARNYFEDVILNSEKILQKIDQFNNKAQRNENDCIQMELLFAQHVCAHIHPTPNTNVGDILLRNGKFVVSYIQIMTRHQKKEYLQKYLYNYFNDLNKISKQQQFFQNKRKAKQEVNIKESQRNNKETKKKIYIPHSPTSSKNQINWSVATQKDQSSSPKSLSNISSLQKQKLTKLKRQQIYVHQLVNQQNQKSEKATKNIKKSIKKNGQIKTKKNQQKSIGKSKQKTHFKSASKQKRSYQKRSLSKSNKNSIMKNKKTAQQQKVNQKDSQDPLGSCYHYLIAINKKNNNKQLKQVRTSARLSKKKQRVSIDQRKKSLRKSSKGKSVHSKRKPDQYKSYESKNKNNDQFDRQIKIESSDSDSQYKTQDSSSEHSDESQEDVDWIKHHLKQLHVKDVQMYADFKALTQNDQKITDFLLQMQNSQEANSQFSQRQKSTLQSKTQQQQNKDEPPSENIMKQNINQQQTYEVRETSCNNQILKPFQQIKQEFQIKELPLTIDRIIDPDLNNHGIYAFVKLGRMTELEMGTAYAVSPLTYSTTASRKFIKEDLQKAKQLAGQYGDNIGYIPMNQHILNMIKQKKQVGPH